MSKQMQETMMFTPVQEQLTVSRTIAEVAAAMEEKGYSSIDQLVGYLLSGDPTYITGYKEARMKIRRFERYELLEELVRFYLKAKH